MIIPDHRIKQTRLGMGIIAEQRIKKGGLIWKHSNLHEFRLPLKLFQAMTQYGYLDGNDVVVDLDESKFFNHSCDANMINSGDDCIAVRDIKPGEELTWDYGSTSLQEFVCRCGSDKCRGMIPSIMSPNIPQLKRPWHNTKSEERSP